MPYDERKIKHSFLFGVVILTVANILTKIMGLIFKIPLTNMLGNMGMGYFNTAYQIYTWLYMLSTAGLPVALSLTVSELNAKNQFSKANSLFRTVITVFSFVGFILSVLLMFFSNRIANLISADLSYFCIASIAPALFFICVSSSIRGYFQGQKNMIPTAVSEIIEAFGKLIVGISLCTFAINSAFPIHISASYAIFGITTGVFGGTFFLIFYSLVKFKKSPLPKNYERISKSENSLLFKNFLKIAFPIMLSSSLLSMSSALDTAIIIRRLNFAGLTKESAITVYGNYTAYCVTLFNLPPVLIYPVVSSLIPSVSALRAQNNFKKIDTIITESFKFTSIVSLPCALGLSVMSMPVLTLIFNDFASVSMASPLLSFLAPSVFLIGIMAVTNGVLQSYKLQKFSLFSMFAGALVKAVSAYFLPSVTIGSSKIYMFAAPISTFLFYLTISLLNLYFINKYCSVEIKLSQIIFKPFISAFFCTVSCAAVYILGSDFFTNTNLLTLISITFGAIVYFLMIFFTGAVKISDLPFLSKFIPKSKIIKEK